MATIGEAVIAVKGDTTDVEKSIGNIAKGLAGLAIAKGAFDFISDGVKRLGEMEIATAKTEQALKNTGGAAGVTAKSIESFSGKVQDSIGVQADLVQSGQNVLLKYTDVRNEIGKGNQVFDRAREAMVDLSVVTGKDMPAAAQILGKALQEPEKAYGALKKAGITLNETQQDTIAKFVATGDVLSAQKVILKEVEQSVGGMADAYSETLPAKLAVARQSFEDVKGAVASSLLPAIELGAEGIIFLTDQFQKLPAPVQTSVGALIGIAAVAGTIAAPVESIVNVFRAIKPAATEASVAVGASAGQLSLLGPAAGLAGAGLAGVTLTAAAFVGVGLVATAGVVALRSALDQNTGSLTKMRQGIVDSDISMTEATTRIQKYIDATDGSGDSVDLFGQKQQNANEILGIFREVARGSTANAQELMFRLVDVGLAGEGTGVKISTLQKIIENSSQKIAEHAGVVGADKDVTLEWATAVTAAQPVLENIKLATEAWTATVSAHAGPMLDSTNSTINYQAAVDKLTEALLLDTTGMDINEQSGRNVAIALENVTIASLEDVKAQIAAAEANHNHAQAQDIAALAAQRMTTDILNSGAAAGYSADQMVMYTADVLNIPPDAVTTILENSADAQGRIQGFINYFLGVNGTTSTVYMNTVYTNIMRTISSGPGWGANILRDAAGSIVGAASGMITRGPAVRLIGESGPEAVVPLGRGANDSRNRMRVMKAAGLAWGGGGTTGAQANQIKWWQTLLRTGNDLQKIQAKLKLNELMRQIAAQRAHNFSGKWGTLYHGDGSSERVPIPRYASREGHPGDQLYDQRTGRKVSRAFVARRTQSAARSAASKAQTVFSTFSGQFPQGRTVAKQDYDKWMGAIARQQAIDVAKWNAKARVGGSSYRDNLIDRAFGLLYHGDGTTSRVNIPQFATKQDGGGLLWNTRTGGLAPAGMNAGRVATEEDVRTILWKIKETLDNIERNQKATTTSGPSKAIVGGRR